MNMLNLAPDIQEAILFLPRTMKGFDPICERDIRPITGVPQWARQRKMWESLSKCISSHEDKKRFTHIRYNGSGHWLPWSAAE